MHDHHKHSHGESCGCEHNHEAEASCHCGHDHEEACHCGHDHEEACHCDHDRDRGSSCGCHGSSCGCGHDHDHEVKSTDLRDILIGGGLFAIGLVLNAFSLPGWIAFVAAYALLGWEVLVQAGKHLLKGAVLDENFLMGIATLGAFAIGEFPEAVGILLFYRIGEYFEAVAVKRSRSQIMEAIDLRPETVTLAEGTTIPTGAAKVGDTLLIRPGDRIGLDCTVLTGESRIDTAPITGEPVPVGVRPGDSLVSGCVNTTGTLTARVDKPLSQSMVTRILEAVENAAAGKPKMDRFISRFARVYTPIVVSVAVLTALVPSLITGQWNYWVYTALSFLVMSCPCALVLSVPLAFFSGIGVGSKQGILFKGGLSMEALAGVKAAALDKTGTLTKGEFTVQTCRGREDLLALCATCEANSTHPIAVSIVAYARAQGIEPRTPEDMEEIPGHGIRATVQGKTLLCGNEKLMARFRVECPRVNEVGSVVLVAEDGNYIGYLVVSDALKSGAREAVDQLHSLGITPAILTGDGEENARAMAHDAGIETVYARLLPEDKLHRLQHLRRQTGPVLFVGDGINDAPVLAGADVGAAMGSGADAAIEAADVVYMTSRVEAIPESIRIARRTRAVAWQNVVFALAVKLAVMVLGLLGHASMWLAVFADSGVAMLCVLNSVRMLYGKKSR